MTPISFMTAFMKSLVDLDADTDKFNKTINALTPFNSAQAVIDSIHSDIASSKSADVFLKRQCGINLSNKDVGGLLGYDASGNDGINSEAVMDETGLPLQQTVPRTAIIEGFTITFPAMNTLTPGGKFINKALYSWWYPLAFKIIKDGYGLGIVDTSYVKQMDTDLYQEPAQNGAIVLAYVSTTFNAVTGIPNKLSCRINTHNDAYGNIDTTNPNGYSANLGTSYLDRTLLHELTHALMSTNIRGYAWLPKYFLEGSAELINGCDDTRGTEILNAINNVSALDDGFLETPSSTLHWYTTGFIFLRYLIRHSTSYVLKDTYRPPTFELLEETNTNGFMFERGITRENNFERIFMEYSEFLQKESDTVQAWELCDNSTLHSYYGNTFRIPLKNAEERIDSDIAEMTIKRKSQFKYIAMTNSPASATYVPTNSYILDDELLLEDFNNYYGQGNSQRVPVSPFDKFNANTKVYVAGTLTLTSICHSGVATKRIDEVIKDNFGCTHVIVNSIVDEKNISLSYYTTKINAELSSCISQGYEYFIFDCTIDISEPISSYIALIDSISNTASSSNVVPIFIGTPHQDDYKEKYKYGKKLVNSITSCKAVDIFTALELLTGTTEDTLLKDVGVGVNNEYIGIIEQWFCNLVFSHMGVPIIEYIFYGVPTEELIKFKIVDKVSKKSPCYYLTLAFHITPDEHRSALRPNSLYANESAEFASFNLHQLYDKNLVSYDQGGGVAKRSFDMEIRDKKTHLGLLNYTKKIPHEKYTEISSEGCYTYPMDNTGCPLISYALEDHEDYDNIEFFFTKTNYGSNITLCFYSSKKESVQPIWQSISFGTFDTHEESYIMPLYIGGGTTGLRSSSYTFSYKLPGKPSQTITKEVNGALYDFSITQYSGSMSNLLYPTKLDSSSITNFFVLAPDGEWKSLYNSVQETRKFGEIDVSTNIVKDTDSHGIVYSTASDDTRDTFDYNTKNMYSLYPISMYSENEENGYMGSLPYNFGVTSKAKTGLTYINGDRYLIIPNGWEHRVAYPFTIDSNSSDSVDEQLRKYMLNISKLYFKNYLAVKVGDRVGTTSV